MISSNCFIFFPLFPLLTLFSWILSQKAAAKEAAEAAEVAKEVALAEGQEASNWLTGEAGEEMGSAAQDFAESSRGMQIVIPEEGEFDDDTDLQRFGD